MVQYMNSKGDRVLVLNPLTELTIYCHPDDYFPCIYGHNKETYPAYVNITTGYAINIYDFLIICQYKFQTKTVLLTIKEYIIAMDHRCREIFLMMDMVDILVQSLGMSIGYDTISVSMHEGNNGALVLV